MKRLEALLIILFACQEPVVPHPIPTIECTKNEAPPTITLTYNGICEGSFKGCQSIPIKSRTQGGSLRIEMDDNHTITDYVIMLNQYHLACSNDSHPSQPPMNRIVKQYAVPLHSRILIYAKDEKGNTSHAVVDIKQDK